MLRDDDCPKKNASASIHPDGDELLVNVHPRDWINPSPAPCYDLVVIGAGTAGLVCAAGAAALGAKVAIVERHLMGGDCLNYGCVPSKTLIRAARAIHGVRTAGVFGIRTEEPPSFDFGAMMSRMRSVRNTLSVNDSAARFRDELSVDVFFGSAAFTGSDQVEVDGVRLNFHRAAVCTGARAVAPPVPGLAEAGYLTNESVFSLSTLPRRLAVLGGGPIGCELAQAFNRFGSEVTLLEMGGRLLPREDSDVSELISEVFGREGVTIRRKVRLSRVEVRSGEKVLHLEQGESMSLLAVDEILVGVGRAPVVEGFGLDRAGVVFDRAGIRVDDHLQTTNRRVYAAGDVCSPYKFTHTADAQARIVIANALFPARKKFSTLTVPWCTFTDPEVAHVGMYEAEAMAKGIEVETQTLPLSEADRYVVDGDTEGFVRVHLKKGTDTILGATVVSRLAGETISEITLCMSEQLGLSALGRTIHPYPTKGDAVRKLSDMHNRTRLTPGIRRLLSTWFRWRRL